MKKVIVLLSILLISCFQVFAQGNYTAGQAVEAIKQNLTCDWRSETVDTFKSGGPETKISGIAVCMFADMDVLRQAVKNNCNMIITHEPVFYNHYDNTKQLEENPVYIEKAKFIKDNNLVIWRFHDHWHLTSPDGIYVGMTRKLGWEGLQDNGRFNRFVIPETNVKSFVKKIHKRVGTNTFRVIGNPKMRFSRVALIAGAASGPQHIKMLEQDDVEMLVVGEAPEWETYLYAVDALQLGKNKAVVFMSHIPSEEAGMEYCAEWLEGFVKDVPVKFIENKPFFYNL